MILAIPPFLILEWKLNDVISYHLFQQDKTVINYLATHQSTQP
jgi:hypothetical protein